MNITNYIPVRKVARSKQKLVLWGLLFYFVLYVLFAVMGSRNKPVDIQVKSDPACLKNYEEKLSQGAFCPDPLQHWNLSDGLDVTWSHATNTRSKLTAALDSTVMMLEADIIMGAGGAAAIPMMGHPPDPAHPGAVDADISMEEWVKRVAKSDKGIKLDFKDINAVEDTLLHLRKVIHPWRLPLMLNADIIDGPGYGQQPALNPEEFVALCSHYFPGATLSIGWTTGAFVFLPNMIYDWPMVNRMAEVATGSGVCQPITFPVRAILVRRSWKQLSALLKISRHFTLTVWSAENDLVNVEDLVWLRGQIDMNRIFYDLPPWLEKLFRDEISGS